MEFLLKWTAITKNNDKYRSTVAISLIMELIAYTIQYVYKLLETNEKS